MQKLLYVPLASLERLPKPIIFVIDALDECGDQSSTGESNTTTRRIVSELIEALITFSCSSVKLPVKFYVTSRPETHIRDTLVSDAAFSKVLRLHTVDKEQVTADICLYISTRLSRNPKLRTIFTTKEVNTLTQLCDGLFIVATIALHYILSNGVDCAATMFKIMLESSQSSLSEDAAPLDRMYTFILEDAAKFDMA